MIKSTRVRDDVQNYYGKILASKSDLKAKACCTGDPGNPRLNSVLREIEPEILNRFYGCGTPLPPLLEGCRVLDLGCGTGRDVYIASKLVGTEGHVTGVDMTEAQLEVGKRHLKTQMKRFGYKEANVTFKKGFMEDLSSLGIESNSMDVVVSNCVINLSPGKKDVFSEIFRVLKPGGELFFSDVFADRRIPKAVQADPVLYGECLAGALYFEDFRRIMLSLGCPDQRVVSCRTIQLKDPAVRAKTGLITFYSITVRAFKLSSLEDRCEDYGQVATYRGTIPDHAHTFLLDDHHEFQKGRPTLVCGNTAAMFEETRYAPHFQVVGNRGTHFGLFDCGCTGVQPSNGEDSNSSGGCC